MENLLALIAHVVNKSASVGRHKNSASTPRFGPDYKFSWQINVLP
jgi:hypothetical protein